MAGKHMYTIHNTSVTQHNFILQLYKTVNICSEIQYHNYQYFIFIYYIDPPVIDEGSFIPRPSVITRGNKRVKIGTPVYVHSGFDVIIDCNISNGSSPITIQWFRNASPYPTRGNVSTITITDARNGDVFKCRVDNVIGFDTENTTIYVEYGKYICRYVYYIYL